MFYVLYDSMRPTSFIYHAAAVFTLNFSYNLVDKK
jgi:hypothetical protein